MTQARKDLEIGFGIEPHMYEITQEKINNYSRYVFHGKDTKNIHTDDQTARKAGFPRTVAQGRYPIGYLSEVMLSFFGMGWIQGGKLDVALVAPIFAGDTITIKAEVKDKVQEGEVTRIMLDVWLENQRGERVTVGTASGIVHDQSSGLVAR